MTNTFLKPSDPLLRKAAQEIPEDKILSLETQNIIKKILKIAFGEQKDAKKPVLVGLAAPQIGISKRIILVDVKSDGKGKVGDLRVYINPQIVWTSKIKGEWYEGCYSIPEICGIVSRPVSIKLNSGEKFNGYVARIFQHEIDHLDGKFFVDLISNPNDLHHVRPEEFPLYRNKKAWKNWPKKYLLPPIFSRLKKV